MDPLPLSSLLDSSSLLGLGFRLTRLLQRSEAFGFDSLALLLLIGPYDVGFFERGLYVMVKTSADV